MVIRDGHKEFKPAYKDVRRGDASKAFDGISMDVETL
jgi:hypothetical protein